MKNRSTHITAADASRIRALHAQGHRAADIAREYGISPTTASRIVRFQLHVPLDIEVVTVALDRRLHAAVALRAIELGITVPTFVTQAIANACHPEEHPA